MLDPFAQLFQHCWGHTRALHMVSKVLLYPCHDALQVPTLLGVGAPLPTLMLQIPTLSLLTQQFLELLGPFVLGLMLRGNGRNIIGQQLWMLHEPAKLSAMCKQMQQLPKMLRVVGQQCRINLHGANLT